MKLSENCQGLNHLGLPTENLEKTIAFYESLGFTVAWLDRVFGRCGGQGGFFAAQRTCSGSI